MIGTHAQEMPATKKVCSSRGEMQVLKVSKKDASYFVVMWSGACDLE
jgi:hypothetical protein